MLVTLTITLVPLAGQIFHFGSEIPQHLLNRSAFGTDICGVWMMYVKDFGGPKICFSGTTQGLPSTMFRWTEVANCPTLWFYRK